MSNDVVEREERLLSMADVCKLLQRSTRAIYADISAGKFPAGFHVGRSRRWRRDEVMGYLDRLQKGVA